MRKYAVVLLLITIFQSLKAQEPVDTDIYYLQPEFMLGKNISNYDEFPHSTYRRSIVLNFGMVNRDRNKHWVSFYHYPSTGIAFSYTDLGNPHIYGQSVSIVPYFILKTSKIRQKSWDFKLGLGGSYFNKHYDAELDPENLVIGSRYNWEFQLFVYRNILVRDFLIIKMGFGYEHNSDSHTQLPNYGMNSAMISLAAELPSTRYDPNFALNHDPVPIDRTKHYFIYVRTGYGWHELGGTVDPIGGRDWPVYSESVAAGIIIKQQLKIRTGITYRFYESFYDYVLKNPVRGLGKHPKSEATNINYFVGIEFLMGHVALDVEGGINLFKPFYREFNYRWEFKKGFGYWRNRYLTSRLGLKYYLINNEKMPRNNISLATHINANFGEADFMDFSLGYTYLIK